MNWEENFQTYDIKNQQFIKHMKFDRMKFVVKYHRFDDEFIIDQVMTLDHQDITSLLRDRTLERMERTLRK